MAGPAEVDAEVQSIVRNVLDIDSAKRMGLTVTLDEISALEFAAMQILHEERDRYAAMEQQRARSRESAKTYF